jgi:hypothetical protein
VSDELRYVRSPAVLWRHVGREVLLIPPDRESVRGLSETAGAIWDLLEEPRSTTEVARILADRYGESTPEIDAQVDRLLEELVGLEAVLRTERP